jgi:hypothetical protein
MFKNNLQTIQRVSMHLEKAIADDENLPEWCQEKIGIAKSMVVTVMDYMISQHENGERHTVAEGGRNYDDNRTGFGRREREDDEYHVPDPVDNRIAYKVIATVTTQDGREEKKGVTVKTTGGPKHAETVGTKHLENAGLQVTGIVSVHDMGPV